MNTTNKLDLDVFRMKNSEIINYRACLAESYKYTNKLCFIMNRFTYNHYWNYKFTSLICQDCVGVREEHGDTYIHFITGDNLAEVLESGVLKMSEHANEHYLGRGVYAFQVNSGRYFKGRDAIVFNTNLLHIHCFSDADACHFGEVLFEQDVKLNNVKVIPSGQVEDFIKSNYDCKYALEHDYGVSYTEDVPLENLYNFLADMD